MGDILQQLSSSAADVPLTKKSRTLAKHASLLEKLGRTSRAPYTIPPHPVSKSHLRRLKRKARDDIPLEGLNEAIEEVKEEVEEEIDAFELVKNEESEVSLTRDEFELYQFFVSYQEGNAGRLVLDPRSIKVHHRSYGLTLLNNTHRSAPVEFGEQIAKRLKL